MSIRKYLKGSILAGLIFLLMAAALFVYWGEGGENLRENESREIKIGKNILQAEIANTPAQRTKGLSGRKELCKNCAMLFIFGEKGKHPFWMKEMVFDLDIIWIDGDKIVHIAKNVSQEKELERVISPGDADKVLEINAGLADELEIKTGDSVGF